VVGHRRPVAAGIGVELLWGLPTYPIREKQAVRQEAGRRAAERKARRSLILQHSQDDEIAPTAFVEHPLGEKFAVRRQGREVERLHRLQIIVDGEEIALWVECQPDALALAVPRDCPRHVAPSSIHFPSSSPPFVGCPVDNMADKPAATPWTRRA